MMNPLDALTLTPTPVGYDFTLDGETLGDCALVGFRLARFWVEPDQRRRGVGRRAMTLLLEIFPPDARLMIEAPADDPGARRFAEAMGFGVTRFVMERPVAVDL